MLNESYVAKHSLARPFSPSLAVRKHTARYKLNRVYFPKTHLVSHHICTYSSSISQHSLFYFWVFSGLLQKYNFPWDCCSYTCRWTQLVLPCLHSNGCSSTGRVHGPDLLRMSFPSLNPATLATSNYSHTTGKNGCISAFFPSQFIKAFQANRRWAIRLLEHFKICPLLQHFSREKKNDSGRGLHFLHLLM